MGWEGRECFEDEEGRECFEDEEKRSRIRAGNYIFKADIAQLVINKNWKKIESLAARAPPLSNPPPLNPLLIQEQSL